MDREDEDLLRQTYKRTFQNYVKGLPFDVPENDQKDWDDPIITEKNGNFGNEMTFCLSNFVKGVMKVMYMLRNHHVLTDVILEVDSEDFHAHKIILAAASPYFKAMFAGGLKECGMKRVKLEGVCNVAMAKLVAFMYTGTIHITETTVCLLLPAATMLQLQIVVDACCVFLEKQLHPTNAIGIANFSERHGCFELLHKANQYIDHHFSQICHEDEFLQLNPMQLVNLIKKDELNVQEEREVYNAVLKWVAYSEESRSPKMEHILRAVRCQYLTPKFIREQMKNCEILQKIPACKQYLENVFDELTLHKQPLVKERMPNTPKIIYTAGGYCQHSLNMMESYNAVDKTWSQHAHLVVPRSGLGAAFLKGFFYAVGGRNNAPGARVDSDWVDKYDPVTDQWRACCPLNVRRYRLGVAVMDGLLYAVGGSADAVYHESVECFDPDQELWRKVTPMHCKRMGVGVAVVNRLLYAIGGYDGTGRLNSVECYHPENETWSMVKPMHEVRSGAGVASIGQYIYVVGGYDGKTLLKTVERYDTENDVWEYMADLSSGRGALSLTALDGKLYAMGGFDGSAFVNDVEIYDPIENSWEPGVPMTSSRSGHGCAVLHHHCCNVHFKKSPT